MKQTSNESGQKSRGVGNGKGEKISKNTTFSLRKLYIFYKVIFSKNLQKHLIKK